ncbi:hypothetical protein C8R46DRAFT_242861 [Mycena filopes]|nr:hypothetical protein C8R46DRAFT_242861 [Mycena filopes]
MYVFGFFLGCVNIVVWIWLLQTWVPLERTHPGRSNVFRYSMRGGRFLLLIPLAVFMGLAPFFAPVVGVKEAQRQAYLHRCDPFAVEVVLEGLPYNAATDRNPVATFSFRENGVLQERYQYNLTSDAKNNLLWHFVLSSQSPESVAPVQQVTYDFGNSTISATCPGNLTECTQGSFEESGYLTFSLTDSRNSNTTSLRAVDNDWDYGKSDDAPSYILKEVQSGGELGGVMVRTAVTNPHHCRLLKLCANNADVETLAPVGLTLLKQNDYSRVCSTPNSN